MTVENRDREPAATESISLPFNKEELLSAFEHDGEFLKEVVEMFISDYPPMMATIREALDDKDASILYRAAHSLKGVLLNFQADSAAKTALKLEEMGRHGELDRADEIYEMLASEIAGLERCLLDLSNEVTR